MFYCHATCNLRRERSASVRFVSLALRLGCFLSVWLRTRVMRTVHKARPGSRALSRRDGLSSLHRFSTPLSLPRRLFYLTPSYLHVISLFRAIFLTFGFALLSLVSPPFCTASALDLLSPPVSHQKRLLIAASLLPVAENP